MGPSPPVPSPSRPLRLSLRPVALRHFELVQFCSQLGGSHRSSHRRRRWCRLRGRCGLRRRGSLGGRDGSCLDRGCCRGRGCAGSRSHQWLRRWRHERGGWHERHWGSNLRRKRGRCKRGGRRLRRHSRCNGYSRRGVGLECVRRLDRRDLGGERGGGGRRNNSRLRLGRRLRGRGWRSNRCGRSGDRRRRTGRRCSHYWCCCGRRRRRRDGRLWRGECGRHFDGRGRGGRGRWCCQRLLDESDEVDGEVCLGLQVR